jgi:hypothetical protein
MQAMQQQRLASGQQRSAGASPAPCGFLLQQTPRVPAMLTRRWDAGMRRAAAFKPVSRSAIKVRLRARGARCGCLRRRVGLECTGALY